MFVLFEHLYPSLLHSRILAMCGDYYIGGRQFESLSDLIGYYTSCSCLLKNEQLVFPVAPQEVTDVHAYVCMCVCVRVCVLCVCMHACMCMCVKTVFGSFCGSFLF